MTIKELSELFSTGSLEENNLYGLEYLNRQGLFNDSPVAPSKVTNAITPQYADLA